MSQSSSKMHSSESQARKPGKNELLESSEKGESGEKYQKYRERNNTNVKRSRERKVIKEKEMAEKYAENQKRIEYLQSVEKQLSSELSSSSSASHKSSKSSQKTNLKSRPDWFGEPF